MGFSNYLRGQIHNDYIVGDCLVQLHTGEPGDDGLLLAAANGLDGKQAVTMGAAVNGFSANTTPVEWGPADTLTVITHTSLWDETGVNCLYTGQLTEQQTINTNGHARFKVDDLVAENR